ncbi:MAG: NAD(P)H-hydrate dehydratase [Ignisphaera sp.]|nr:NAD(P)H-hydrate dehydratase [Ignisphaera sp.]MCX8167667.1 NAD(P)H-hydrate dehydratase [Ignisphaera sp.]MDW8085657.1 NAD(P)H-hydrate dehydratase [Ignisphaera sp.]
MDMHRIKVCSVAEMRRIDEDALRIYGVDHRLLMEDAGTAIYTVVLENIGIYGRRFLVVAGTGNNGGDALVAARRIFSAGGDIKVLVVGDPSKFTELTRSNFEIVKNFGIPTDFIKDWNDLQKLSSALTWCDAIIVGIIGIGLRDVVRGIHRDVIEAVNSSGKPVVSVDIPSGIGGDNGRVYGVAIKSSYTVTFGLPKYGNILYPGYSHCGKLFISRLSYPPQLYNSTEIKAELNLPVPPPERVRWGHKGTFGKYLVVAGSKYYYGAPYYASYSFLKAGGGYSRLAAPKSVVPIIASKSSEVVYIPLEETGEGSISRTNYNYIIEMVDQFDIDIVALGPGTSLNEETQQLIVELTEAIKKPVIIDGDGITAIAKRLDALKRRRIPAILTPHPVEFSRLSGMNLSDIQEDPIGILRKVSMELNSYIVLKGAHSLIGYPDGYIYINMTGNPGMAKAGSGDVLTGTIAAMYGIGYRDLGEALRMGVLVHGLAGDLAADSLGEDGVTPDDILRCLPSAVKILRSDPSYIIDRYMPRII